MPIVEYYAPATHTIYQFLARNQADAKRVPRCPGGARLKMERVVSGFAITGRAREKADASDAEEEFTPAQEAAMMRLASQMEGLSDDNPDPRQLGRLMREMSSILGKDKMPAEMDEMIRRLEAGEDPEKLEEQFGDALGDDALPDPSGSGDAPTASGTPRARRRVSRLRRQLPARRDPALYELRDFLQEP